MHLSLPASHGEENPSILCEQCVIRPSRSRRCRHPCRRMRTPPQKSLRKKRNRVSSGEAGDDDDSPSPSPFPRSPPQECAIDGDKGGGDICRYNIAGWVSSPKSSLCYMLGSDEERSLLPTFLFLLPSVFLLLWRRRKIDHLTTLSSSSFVEDPAPIVTN